MSTAKFIRKLDGFTGDARLYAVDPPIVYHDDGEKQSDHVIASATVVMGSGPETYLFPADVDGEVLDWGELDGSYRGGLDHEQALSNAGYEVTE